MNGKQARKLRKLATQLVMNGTVPQDSRYIMRQYPRIVQVQKLDPAGIPIKGAVELVQVMKTTVRCSGWRAACQALKRGWFRDHSHPRSQPKGELRGPRSEVRYVNRRRAARIRRTAEALAKLAASAQTAAPATGRLGQAVSALKDRVSSWIRRPGNLVVGER